MDSAAINLLASVVPDSTGPVTGKTPVSAGKEDSSFFAMLTHLSGGLNGGQAMPGIEENGKTETFRLADGSSVILSAAEVKGLVEMLQAMEAGMQASNADIVKQAAPAGAEAGETTETAQSAEERVKSLLMGLLSLLATKKGETGNGGTTEGQKVLADVLQGLGLSGDPEKKTEGGAETGSSTESTDNAIDVGDEATLEMLAFLIFSSLQALAQKQNDEDVSLDSIGRQSLPAAAPDIVGDTQGTFVPDAPAPAREAGNDDHPKTNGNDNVASFLKNLAEAREAAAAGSDAQATGPEIKLTPSAQEEAAKNVTLTIMHPSREVDRDSERLQTAFEVVAGMTVTETMQAGAIDGSAEGTAIVANLSPLLENKEDERSGDGAGEKSSSSDDGQYQFAGNHNVSKAAGEEAKTKTADRPASSGAVEKFDRIFEQISSRGSNHDLTVRLDIGNKESLLLGFKDMGQGISVEVKASHQAITDLLQTQKDAIMKHLEAKDVHVTIQIDPDASAQDRRDRRESRDLQRNPFAKNEETEGFGEYLEIFA